MTSLPVIVGFGGFNAAGRSSFHHAYLRMVIESISPELRQQTFADLAVLMGLLKAKGDHYVDELGNRHNLAQIELKYGQLILNSTLVRRIEKKYFDVDALPWQQSVTLENASQQHTVFTLPKKQLPVVIPSSWQVKPLDKKTVQVSITENLAVKVDSVRDFTVKSAGQFPMGFEPSEHYPSRFHPRSLQMAILGASDALQSVGIDWQTIVDQVKPDEIAVYSSNIMGQMDEDGLGGMMTARLKGQRITSKQCPLGHNSMTADFINAYVLGSVGATASITGACASFLYNLRAGIEDIQAGRRRVVMVGNSETPINPEVLDGYASMSALASVEGLKNLDHTGQPDLHKTSRPFGENCGFTIAESSQYIVLMDDALAMELGADIHGAVTDVFVNADGVKKSISSPGAGNYITMAKAVASATALLGQEAVQQRSFVQAHGSSTPQNRVTESKIFHEVAHGFNLHNWPVTAVKSYLGHSLASASADQLMSTLGVFKHGILPGIKTHNKVADDVHSQRLDIALQDQVKTPKDWDVAFLNSKGFGGNNATATVISPNVVDSMLSNRYSPAQMQAYYDKRAITRSQAQAYDQQASQGNLKVIYRFGESMIDESKIEINQHQVRLPGFANPIELPKQHVYQAMLPKQGAGIKTNTGKAS